MTVTNQQIEKEAIRTTAMLLAMERWAKTYSEAPEQHAALIKSQANLQISLTKLFRSMAKNASSLVNWAQYTYQLNTKPAILDREALDYDVNVIVNDDQISDYDGQLIKLTLTPVTAMIGAGAAAAEQIYGIPLGIKSTDAIIQKLGTDQIAALVGKKVMPDGSLIDNPDAEYNIMDTVRADIAQSIKTSLALGRTTEEATADIARIIQADGYRAERIANTEAVNAYNAGVMEFGSQSEAKGKEWDDAGSTDECADNAGEGIIGIDETFDSGDDQPPAHPNCMCAIRLVYQDEIDAQDN